MNNLDLSEQALSTLKKSVTRYFNGLAVFFVITFIFFTAFRIYKDGIDTSLMVIRTGFLVVAFTLLQLIKRSLQKSFQEYRSKRDVSELSLRFRESSKASLLSNLDEGILEFDIATHQCLTMTQPFLDDFEFIQEPFGGSLKDWNVLVAPEDRDMIRAVIERRSRASGSDRCEVHMFSKQGNPLYIRLGIASVISEPGQGLLILSHQDITAHRSIEKQKMLLTSIIEENPEAYWIFDEHGHNIYTSTSAAELIQRAQRYQCKDLDFILDPASLRSQLLVHLNPGTPYRRILQPHTPLNSAPLPRFGLLSAFTIESNQDENHYVVAFKDISDAYEREMEVKLLKDRMELALGAARIGVWEWDLNSQQMSWDNHLYDLFELNPQIKPTHQHILSKVVPEDSTSFQSQLYKSLEGKKPFDTHFRIQRMDGRVLHIKGVGQLVQSEFNPNPNRMFGIFWDITDEMTAREELARSQIRQQNSARLAALGEMASGVAHEINNPLSVISARAVLLKHKLKSGATQGQALDFQAALESIESNVERISKIIKGLRTFSRDGEKDPQQVHDLKVLLDDTLGVCTERFRSAGVKLVIQNQAPPQHQLICRGVQIAQVLINLINNAFDAAQSAKDAAADRWVHLDIFVDAEGTHLLVSDSGKGVPIELEEKIMQPFFTTKEVGKGTGLGLSISQAIIKDHGGKLFLDRNRSASCFHIVIPEKNEIPSKQVAHA